MANIKIEVGKFYRSVEGEKVGPMGGNSITGFWSEGERPLGLWTESGSRYFGDTGFTLVAEWVDDVAAEPPANGGWIEWNGGECPVPDGTIVEVRFRGGRRSKAGRASGWIWLHAPAISWAFPDSDIVAYRLVKQEQPHPPAPDTSYLASESGPVGACYLTIESAEAERDRLAEEQPGAVFMILARRPTGAVFSVIKAARLATASTSQTDGQPDEKSDHGINETCYEDTP